MTILYFCCWIGYTVVKFISYAKDNNYKFQML